MLIAILIILLTLSVVALVFSLLLNRKLMAFAQRFEENYTAAQNILDETYQELDAVLAKAMVSDDPIVRRVMAQLAKCRDDVFATAKLISMQDDKEENDDSGTE